MENPRPEKVAVVTEVRQKLEDADAVVFTEYRGLTVRDLQELRSSLRGGGGEYRVYKNTLVRRASAELELPVSDELTGPTALAFVGERPDGAPGDPVLVAKALKSFAKANPALVIKGGLLGGQVLDAAGVSSLADVAPREELLARLAGGMAAPMQNFAALLKAVPQKFAYALTALVEAGGAPGAPTAATEAATTTADEAAGDTTDGAAESAAQDDAPAEAAGDPTPEGDAPEVAEEEE